MENPANGWEIVVGLFTGTLGFATADVLDRLVTTRERKDDKGNLLPVRFPEAPLVDDFLPRVGVGVLVAAVPLGAAQFIHSSMGRSALQFFGFGAAFRLLGKAVDDLAAYVFKDSAADSMGKKLFAGEIGQRAAVGLTGLGAAPCPSCGQRAGLGACGCRSMLPQYAGNQLPIQPSPISASIPPGGGVPPVVTQGPPPAITTVPTTPFTPAIPPRNVVPGQPPSITAGPVGMHGLGDVGAAREVLRVPAHASAYTALRRNRDILSRAWNGSATPAQRQLADRIVAQHKQSFAVLQQHSPNALDTAARGLGMVVDDAPSTFPGTSRHRDEAAE